jgi:predicted nucleic acid-binding protein
MKRWSRWSEKILARASLAALAIEHRATRVSTDQKFARIQEANWINPAQVL